MRKQILAAVLGGASLAVAAAPLAADAKARPHRHLVCKQHSAAHNNRGTVIGAVAGGLLGNAVSSGGGKTGGTLLGAGAGAVAGHQIAKHSGKKDCHWVYDRRSRR
jgi:uncharacterized protein YcfJ